MNVNQLGEILSDMYENAKTDKTTMIHLFGIKYAHEIRTNEITAKEILKVAKMPESYIAEINKGINLAKYVEPKEQYK